MNDPRQKARKLLHESDTITLERLWCRYWGQGGNTPKFEFEACLYEALAPDPIDLAILSWALEDLDIGSAR